MSVMWYSGLVGKYRYSLFTRGRSACVGVQTRPYGHVLHDLRLAVLLLQRLHQSADVDEAVEKLELLLVEHFLGRRHARLDPLDDRLADRRQIVGTAELPLTRPTNAYGVATEPVLLRLLDFRLALRDQRPTVHLRDHDPPEQLVRQKNVLGTQDEDVVLQLSRRVVS